MDVENVIISERSNILCINEYILNIYIFLIFKMQVFIFHLYNTIFKYSVLWRFKFLIRKICLIMHYNITYYCLHIFAIQAIKIHCQTFNYSFKSCLHTAFIVLKCQKLKDLTSNLNLCKYCTNKGTNLLSEFCTFLRTTYLI